MPQNTFFLWTRDLLVSQKTTQRHFIFILHPLSTVIFATTTVLAFVLLRTSSFNFHCYTQREATPTQKSARKCAATSHDFFAVKDYKAHSLEQTSFAESPNNPVIHLVPGETVVRAAISPNWHALSRKQGQCYQLFWQLHFYWKSEHSSHHHHNHHKYAYGTGDWEKHDLTFGGVFLATLKCGGDTTASPRFCFFKYVQVAEEYIWCTCTRVIYCFVM